MKKIKYLLLLLLLLPFTCSASTNTKDRNELDNLGVNKHWNINENNRQNVLNTKYVDASEKIYDYSDILTEEEENEIKEKIDKYIEHTNMDMVFVSVNLPYVSDNENEDFAADFYDYNDFGLNFESYSGVLLLRNTYEQDPYFGIYLFGKAQLYYETRYESTMRNIYNDFHSNSYLNGISLFIEEFTNFYDQGIPNQMENYYVDKDSKLQEIPKNYYIDKKGILHKKPYNAPWGLITILDTIITLITTSILVHKNKMVKQKLVTKDYVDKNGAIFTKRENNLVKEYVTHVTHDTSSSSGGGGGFSSSIGSSGGGHSGGGMHG